MWKLGRLDPPKPLQKAVSTTIRDWWHQSNGLVLTIIFLVSIKVNKLPA
jgi:hypothetical protein